MSEDNLFCQQMSVWWLVTVYNHAALLLDTGSHLLMVLMIVDNWSISEHSVCSKKYDARHLKIWEPNCFQCSIFCKRALCHLWFFCPVQEPFIWIQTQSIGQLSRPYLMAMSSLPFEYVQGALCALVFHLCQMKCSPEILISTCCIYIGLWAGDFALSILQYRTALVLQDV